MKHGLMRTRIANGDWIRADQVVPPGSVKTDQQLLEDAVVYGILLENAARNKDVPTFCVAATADALVSGVRHITQSRGEELAIPYGEMWLEYSIDCTSGLVQTRKGCLYAKVYEDRIGLLLTSYSSVHDALFGPTARGFVLTYVGSSGGCVPIVNSKGAVQVEYTPLVIQITPEERRELEQAIAIEWPVLMYLFTMLSCRNVEVVKREHSGEYDRKRRKVKGGYQYHTLVVRNKDKRIVYDADPLAPESPAALHMVRGHFKTYTAEAPLMGKLTGRYYWPPHARGSREVGEIEHEYRVG